MFVVGHPRQTSVEGHHDEGELGQGAQQTGSVPSEARLQVKLYNNKKRFMLVVFFPHGYLRTQ